VVQKKVLGEVDLPVKSATNLTFHGPKNDKLFVTAGVPRLDNCEV
jgi:sugar lactone lactonase YvrE